MPLPLPPLPPLTSPACLLALRQVGGEFAISSAEQRRQIDALKALEGCLAAMAPPAAANFEGLSIRWVCSQSGLPPWPPLHGCSAGCPHS